MQPEYYKEEQFAKRLLGNSFSVPTVEKLLKPISKLFAVRDYGEMFNYQFAWKDWKEESDEPQFISERLKAYLQDHPEFSQSLMKEIGSKPNAIEAARSRHVATQPPTKVSEAKMNQVSRRLLEEDPLDSDKEDDFAFAAVV